MMHPSSYRQKHLKRDLGKHILHTPCSQQELLDALMGPKLLKLQTLVVFAAQIMEPWLEGPHSSSPTQGFSVHQFTSMLKSLQSPACSNPKK